MLINLPEDETFIYRIIKRPLYFDRVRRKLILEGKIPNVEVLKNLNPEKKDNP